jgi:hypothetical protein
MQASTSMAYASDIMVAWAAGNLMNVVSHDTAIVQTT